MRPTKALVKSARIVHLIGLSEEYGIKNPGHEVDFPAVMDWMNRVIRRAGEHGDPARFREMGVDVFLGDEASFVSPQEVSVDGRQLGARSVILATGSHPVTPPVEGLEEVSYLTNVEALQLRRLPRSLIVIGSGSIGRSGLHTSAAACLSGPCLPSSSTASIFTLSGRNR